MATVKVSELRTAAKYSITFFNDTTIWEVSDRSYIDVPVTDESADFSYTRIKNALECANKQDSKQLKQLCNAIVLNRGFEFEQTHPTIK
jgi:hypothetical protein